MKIHFSNVNFGSTTGPNTFAYRLATQLIENGHEVVSEKDPYDIFLAFIEPTSAPRPGSKVVQRLDGIWFKPEEFETKNTVIKFVYEHAHAVVWQSEFDKQMTQKWWGAPKYGEVIHNGIKLEKKAINELGLQRLRKEHGMIFVSSANWHPQKRLQDNIAVFKQLQKTYDTSCLIVLGNNANVIADPHIFFTGNVPHDICLQIYSAADWMIHTAWLDHCPNTVIEALSQGTPVICTDSGGTKEIVRKNGIILPDTEYNFELMDYDNPDRVGLTTLPNELPDVLVDNSHLDIKLAAKKYEDLFIKLMSE